MRWTSCPEGAWVERGYLLGPVDEAAVAALEASLVEYFSRTEHRGGNCKIDPIRRGSEEIFFAYAEDHPDTEWVWQGDQLSAQMFNPAFRLKQIFKHNDERRTLDIHVAGDRRKVPELQQLFAKALLGEEIPEFGPGDDLIYYIDRVLMDGFEFEYSTELGITDVRVVKVRFLLEGEPWRRLLVEADNAKVRDALNSFVTDLTGNLPKRRLRLDHIYLKVSFEKREDDRRGRIRDCIITSPNVLRLKKDDLGEKIEEMLVQVLASSVTMRSKTRDAAEAIDPGHTPGPRCRAGQSARSGLSGQRGLDLANRAAVQALLDARLLKRLTPAESVTCLGCEERCRRPVVVSANDDDLNERVTWTCHLYSDFGPFEEPVEVLRRWTSSREMVAKFIGRSI